MNKKKLLFVGFGDIAQRCVNALNLSDRDAVGISRRAKSDTKIEHWQGDVKETEILKRVAQTQFDLAIITLTPGQRGQDAYRNTYYDSVSALTNLWQKQSRPPFIIFVSSTSVYGQSFGEWVDETTEPKPSSPTAQVLLETENLLRNTPLKYSIVRFSGIYGPGRDYLLRQVAAGKAGDEAFTNRIHIDDCTGFLCHLAHQVLTTPNATPNTLFIASDSQPVQSRDIREWLAKQLNTVSTPQTTAAIGSLSPSARVTNKRCRNQAMLDTGYTLLFKDYRSGYEACIKQFLDNKSLQEK